MDLSQTDNGPEGPCARWLQRRKVKRKVVRAVRILVSDKRHIEPDLEEFVSNLVSPLVFHDV